MDDRMELGGGGDGGRKMRSRGEVMKCCKGMQDG